MIRLIIYYLFIIGINALMNVTTPLFKQEPAGVFIKLKCATTTCLDTNIFRWEFQACAPDHPFKPKCQNISNTTWKIVSEKNKSNYCTSTFTIQKSNLNHSGVYRCLKISLDSQQQVVKVFQLNIIERINFRNGKKPIVLEIQPSNKSVTENTKIVIQCKVFSDFNLPPDIWWLKQLESPVKINGNYPIFHNNKSYLNMNTSQKELGNYTFISKLIIEKSTEMDTGIYTCLAVNMIGSSDKDVFINVVKVEKQRSTSCFLLFLIPVTFALLPASVWLCLYCYRKKKMKKLNAESNKIYKYQPVLRQDFNSTIV